MELHPQLKKEIREKFDEIMAERKKAKEAKINEAHGVSEKLMDIIDWIRNDDEDLAERLEDHVDDVSKWIPELAFDEAHEEVLRSMFDACMRIASLDAIKKVLSMAIRDTRLHDPVAEVELAISNPFEERKTYDVINEVLGRF